MERIDAGLLIPGRGEPVRDATVLIDGARIAYAGPAAGRPGGGGALPRQARLGMTPLQAIEAATATAPRTLGPQAPRSGLLAAGYDADLLCVEGDPLADISILARPDAITGVWAGGRQVKGGGAL